MPPAGFEPAISASDLQKTYALKSAAIGLGLINPIIIVSSLEATPSIILAIENYDVLLTVHLSIILVIDQLITQILVL